LPCDDEEARIRDMIGRKTAMAIANAYTSKFSHYSSSSYSRTAETVYRDSLYDFLYENGYEAWFCNMAKHIFGIRALTEWVLKIHTGESLANATPNWSWDRRAALGQVYLKNLAKDFIVFYSTCTDSRSLKEYETPYEKLVRRLELDGYVFRDNDLFQVEADVLDVEAESGLLANLHNSLGLPDREQTFEFLNLAESHYVAGRWSDSVSNSRKFFEAILQQVAAKYASSAKGTTLSQQRLQRPVEIRKYLEAENLVERKEREAIDKIYGLLSHTGSHPYMAEKDQARLLRQISLIMTQFIILRLEGALKTP
jgi:hypothetical protein